MLDHQVAVGEERSASQCLSRQALRLVMRRRETGWGRWEREKEIRSAQKLEGRAFQSRLTQSSHTGVEIMLEELALAGVGTVLGELGRKGAEQLTLAGMLLEKLALAGIEITSIGLK